MNEPTTTETDRDPDPDEGEADVPFSLEELSIPRLYDFAEIARRQDDEKHLTLALNEIERRT